MSALSKKRLHRAIRFNSFVERAQQIVRLNSRLDLPEIGLSINIERGDVLIDCGANIGGVTSAFARTGAQVYSFEPNPLCFSVLRSRFARTPNVELFHQGVMDRNCTLTLTAPKAHAKWDDVDATVSGSFHHGTPVEAETTDVACIDLSQFILSLNKDVRLLKLDIEGSEIEVLNRLIDTGAISRVGLAVAETHEKQHPELTEATDNLRARIEGAGLASKIRLDWT
ncbi:hypothetical protein XI06_15090 [Bradyrhizobium sp. CCBAU 11434]|uniref:FkbM family methyltransferase n=1 Tax=Bradyrhizobium sp. CCBAU 11434 TaxID=1630885 RepID=UPI002304D643|nr:FkbM family methyltransferase [Bradyrhizobium sp. CCBAU 11434]MDA9521633.1 hypothetical protein [Bradyrhizobium sp. CCBAU 11434]